MTTAELAFWLDDSRDRTRAAIQKHRELFRIADWQVKPRSISIVWGVADGTPDAPKPQPMTSQQKMARYRQAKKEAAIASPWAGLL